MTTFGELKLQGVLNFSDGYRTKVSELAACGYRILRAGDVRDGRPVFDSPDFVDERMLPAIGNKQVRERDVVLTTKGTVGRTAFVHCVPYPAVYSPQLCFFRTDSTRLDPRYLYYWFSGSQFRHQSFSLMSSTDMAPYMSLSQLEGIDIDIPEVREQQAIAEVLGALDDKIAANSRLSLLVEERLRALFERDIRRGEPRFLSEFLLLNPRRKPPSDPAPQIPMQMLPSPGVAIPEFGVASPNGGVRFMNGDTLLARITPSLENGKTGYVLCLRDGEVGFGSTEYIVMRSRSGYPLPLSYFVATDPGFRAEAIQRMVGSSGRQRVKADDLADLTFPLTKDGRALERFESCAGPELQLTQTLAVESRTLARLRDALLPPLMDGTLRVKDAVAQVEEVL